MLSSEPDSDDDSDEYENTATTPSAHVGEVAAVTISHSHLHLDAFEVLALQFSIASPSEGTKALVALSSTCHTYRRHGYSTARAWDALTRRCYSFFEVQKLDVHVGFPFLSPRWTSTHELSEIELMQNLCSGVVDSASARALCGSSVAWCTTQCRNGSRAAYSRPTIGQLAETPCSNGGLANLAALARASGALRRRISVMECDIARLPRHVDMLVIPSNEWLHNPGWGVIDALYDQGGVELAAWVNARTRAQGEAIATGPVLASGQAITSPAYGAIRAKYLCHSCGVGFFDPVQFQHVAQALDEGERASDELHRAAHMQLALLRTIFAEAARCGCRSIAIPAVSAGKRRFPALLASAITMGVAAREVLASGLDLEVLVVAFGDENWLDCFECAKDHAVRQLVGCAAP